MGWKTSVSPLLKRRVPWWARRRFPVVYRVGESDGGFESLVQGGFKVSGGENS